MPDYKTHGSEKAGKRHTVMQRDDHGNIKSRSSTQLGYNSKWQRARIRFLRRHPICAACEANGRITPARDVDHIEPHKGDMVKFWDESNWQALCQSCHSEKTARENGGFGNKEK